MKQLIKTVLARMGYRVQGTSHTPRQLLEAACLRALEFDDLVARRMFEVGPALNFIQVGVFDGITHDPLRKYIEKCGWRGVLVEPQSGAVRKLRELYRDDDRIVVLQAAVAGETGSRTLFTVESNGAPAWAGGLASFDREVVAKHASLIPGLEGMIREELVNCVSFDEVLGHFRPERLDVLQIDTEGADALMLALFPFDRLQPAIVHWEVKHLAKAQREACLGRLAAFGYRFAASGDEDMMAVRF